MAHSGEIWVLGKIAELANRCGLNPAAADVEINLILPESGGYHYSIFSMEGDEGTDVQDQKIEKFRSLLGLDERGQGQAANLREIDERVDRALAIMPRPRSR